MFSSMDTTCGRATGLSASSGGQVLKQERAPQRRHSDTAWMVLTKLRVNLELTIATMARLPVLCLAVCAPRLRSPPLYTLTLMSCR